MNQERFDSMAAAVDEGLRKACEEGEYNWGSSLLGTVQTRMRAALKAGTYNYDGPAFKIACKLVGIKQRRKAIEEFIGRKDL